MRLEPSGALREASDEDWRDSSRIPVMRIANASVCAAGRKVPAARNGAMQPWALMQAAQDAAWDLLAFPREDGSLTGGSEDEDVARYAVNSHLSSGNHVQHSSRTRGGDRQWTASGHC